MYLFPEHNLYNSKECILNQYPTNEITFASSSLPKAFKRLPKSLRTQNKSCKRMLFL